MIECFRIENCHLVFALDKECARIGSGISQWYELLPNISAADAVVEAKRNERNAAIIKLKNAAECGLPKTAIEAAADYAKAQASLAHYEVIGYVLALREAQMKGTFKPNYKDIVSIEDGLRRSRRWALCDTEAAHADIVRDITGDKLLSTPKVIA